MVWRCNNHVNQPLATVAICRKCILCNKNNKKKKTVTLAYTKVMVNQKLLIASRCILQHGCMTSLVCYLACMLLLLFPCRKNYSRCSGFSFPFLICFCSPSFVFIFPFQVILFQVYFLHVCCEQNVTFKVFIRIHNKMHDHVLGIGRFSSNRSAVC